jgi:hypothetical protein
VELKMAIKKFDKQNLDTLRTDITAALSQVEKKHGIKLSLDRIRYNENTFSAKLEAMTVDASAPQVEGNVKWQTQFKQMAVFYDLEPTDLGKEFVSSGVTYKIVGAMSGKARSQQIIVQRKDSDKFQRMDAEVVKLMLKK